MGSANTATTFERMFARATRIARARLAESQGTAGRHWHYVALVGRPGSKLVDAVVGAEPGLSRAAAIAGVAEVIDRFAIVKSGPHGLATVATGWRAAAPDRRRGLDYWTYAGHFTFAVFWCGDTGCVTQIDAILADYLASSAYTGYQLSRVPPP
ncbi:MAG TPA: hypothetical protein VGD67_08080 [Pseudonocardiaceae bacterium]